MYLTEQLSIFFIFLPLSLSVLDFLLSTPSFYMVQHQREKDSLGTVFLKKILP